MMTIKKGDVVSIRPYGNASGEMRARIDSVYGYSLGSTQEIKYTYLRGLTIEEMDISKHSTFHVLTAFVNTYPIYYFQETGYRYIRVVVNIETD